jgi:hypothetical protein
MPAADDATPRGTLPEVIQQSRLPDARFAAEDEHLTLPRLRGREQLVERRAFVRAAAQHAPTDDRHDADSAPPPNTTSRPAEN